jgi:hypothetical protein
MQDTTCDNEQSTTPAFVAAELHNLADETIGRFIDRTQITDDSSVVLSVPAGPNRARNFMPVMNIAQEVHKQVPAAKLIVDLAIDVTEAMREIVEPTPDAGIPSSSKIQEYFPDLAAESIEIRPRLQEVSNSVVETRTAMIEAAEAGSTHLIAPRFGKPLANRVGRGLRHYSTALEDSSLEVVAAPAHSLYEDAAPGGMKRLALEWTSYIVGELAYRLGGASFYEQYTERKGFFGEITKKAQEIKLRNFERGKDAQEMQS